MRTLIVCVCVCVCVCVYVCVSLCVRHSHPRRDTAAAVVKGRVAKLEKHELLQENRINCALHCQPGQFVEKMCSDTASTVCKACGGGFWSTGGLAQECRACSKCAPGTTQSASCTRTADTQCKPCTSGTFSSLGGTSACQTCPKNVCRAGHLMKQACSVETGKAACAPCPVGTYQDAQGIAATCKSCKRCTGGRGALQCGGASKGVCVDPDLGFAIAGTKQGCDAWSYELWRYKGDYLCTNPKTPDLDPSAVCVLDKKLDVGQPGSHAYDTLQACNTQRNIFNIKSLDRFKDDPKLPWKSGAFGNYPSYARWDGRFEMLGGQWRVCFKAYHEARISIDGKAIVDTMSPRKVCPLGPVGGDNCACGALIEVGKGEHDIALEYVEKKQIASSYAYSICRKQDAPKEKLARIRVTNQRLCMFKNMFNAAQGSTQSDSVHVRSCAADDNMKKTQTGDWIISPEVADPNGNGGVLKWQCGTRQNPQWCPPGTDICATFNTNGKDHTLVQERCDANPKTHSLFRFNNAKNLGRLFVKVRPTDTEWLCVAVNAIKFDHWDYIKASTSNGTTPLF